MHVTVSETFGDKPISDWLEKKVKQFFLERHGLDVEVALIFGGAAYAAATAKDEMCHICPGKYGPTR